MPRSVVVGNGNILVGLDDVGQVRDFYFPYVGLENHVGGHNRHRIGVWADGEFRWIDDASWKIEVQCALESFFGAIRARNEALGVELSFTDVVYNERDIFIRRIEVKNLRSSRRVVKLFFGHQFEIYESHRGDSAYYDPIHHCIIHYKGRRVFLANARVGGATFDDYAVGVFNIEGKEGTHRDAEDGELSKNPVEHGPTDSVIGVTLILEPEKVGSVHYWLAVAETVDDVLSHNEYLLKKGAEHLIRTTTDYWRAWVDKYQFQFQGLPDSVQTLFKKSLFIVRAHVDEDGAIIASSDSDMFQLGKDTYAYMWPRDAAFAAMALDRAGDANVARRFFEFCRDVVTTDGYFMHKYRPDKSLGSSWHAWVGKGAIQLPIQEDETALVLVSLWKHYEITRDLEFIESVYQRLVERTGNFLLSFRDFRTGLPKPSYDLWEERLGIHTFTAAAAYGGLQAAAKFANLLGKKRSEGNFLHGAEEIRRSIIKYLYDESRGVFNRRVIVEGGEIIPDTTIDISGPYGVFLFGVLPPEDPKLKRAFEGARAALTPQTSIGGIARYEGDRYYADYTDVPGNPWIITTLWYAEYLTSSAQHPKELDDVRKLLGWVADRALASGVLPEQVNPHTGAPISATPLTWSHAQFVIAVIHYLNKLEKFGLCLECNPVK